MKREAKLIGCMSNKVIIFTIMSIMMIAGFLLSIGAKEVNAAEYQREKRNVNELTLALESNSFEYTGESIQPYPSVKDSNGMSDAIEDRDFSVTYGSNVEPGKGTITITGLGASGKSYYYEWYGIKTFEFTITKADPLNLCGLSGHDEELILDLHNNDVANLNKELFIGKDVSLIRNIKNKKYKSTNKNVFTIKNNKMYSKGVGIAYLIVNIPETTHTLAKQFKFKVTVKPQLEYNGMVSRNGKLYVYFEDKDMAKSKTNFKYKINIYSKKSCNKKYLVKTKILSNGKKVAKGYKQTIKGLKKGKNYWVKVSAYKKIDSKTTLDTGSIKTKIKIK